MPVVIPGGRGRVDPALSRPLDERGAAHLQAPLAVEPLELVQSPPRAAELRVPQRDDRVFRVALLGPARAAGRRGGVVVGLGGRGPLPLVELGLELVELRVDGRLVALAAGAVELLAGFPLGLALGTSAAAISASTTATERRATVPPGSAIAASTTSVLCSSTTASSAVWPILTEPEISPSAESDSSAS